MDESPILMRLSHLRGNKLKRQQPGALPHRQPVTRGMSRQYCSLVAWISNIAAVQTLLPQIINAPKGLVNETVAATIVDMLEDPVCLHVSKSHWMNGPKLCMILELVRLCLERPMPGSVFTEYGPEPSILITHQVVVMVDSALPHFSDEVLQLLKEFGWQFMLVPACMTWLLQPLDVYVFGKFKRCLTRLATREEGTRPGEYHVITTMRQVIRMVIDIISSGSWTSAFERLG